MKVYHWTTKQNAAQILRYGLRQWSFVCRRPDDWHGEICLEIEWPFEFIWEERDLSAQWQAIAHEPIKPDQITIYNIAE